MSEKARGTKGQIINFQFSSKSKFNPQNLNQLMKKEMI